MVQDQDCDCGNFKMPDYTWSLMWMLGDEGFEDWFYCPGSRDAPFGYSFSSLLEANQLRAHVCIDERDAAFMALGAARAGFPAVVVMTSGTAVGNALPAVMEASHSGLPLLVLSADRPATLRGTGANQTTWQPGIFGDFVRFEADLQPPQSENDLFKVVTQAAKASRGELPEPPQAVTAKHFPAPGPIHINASLTEPLAPPETIAAFEANAAQNGYDTPKTIDPKSVARGPLLIAGDLSDGCGGAESDWDYLYSDLIAAVSALGIPVLAEPQTFWRTLPEAVKAYSQAAAGALREVVAHDVTRVIVVGRPTLTRPITRLISRRDIPVETVGAVHTCVNLAGNVARHWQNPADLADDLQREAQEQAEADGYDDFTQRPHTWLDLWQAAGDAAAAQLSEPWGIHAAAAAIWQASVRESGQAKPHLRLPWDSHDAAPASLSTCDLYLGASLTIRAFDAIADHHLPDGSPLGARKQPPRMRVYTNRGLAGIDGTIASAWGAALATERPVRLVLGDVSFFHDLGALRHGSCEATPNLQVIVFNNGGGRIFGGLEHGAAPADTFTRMFLTPQVGDICGLARAAGWEATRVNSLEGLVSALSRPVAGLSVLEVVF